MLLVDRETGLANTQNKNSFFCGRCPYIVCAQNRLELMTWSANRSAFESTEFKHSIKLSVREADMRPGFSEGVWDSGSFG